MFKQALSVDKQCHRSVGAAGGELKGTAAVVLCFIFPARMYVQGGVSQGTASKAGGESHVTDP